MVDKAIENCVKYIGLYANEYIGELLRLIKTTDFLEINNKSPIVLKEGCNQIEKVLQLLNNNQREILNEYNKIRYCVDLDEYRIFPTSLLSTNQPNFIEYDEPKESITIPIELNKSPKKTDSKGNSFVINPEIRENPFYKLISTETDYKPIDILGKGGFSTVFLVKKRNSNDQLFALKLLTNPMDYKVEWIDKTRREFKAMRKISEAKSDYVVYSHYFAQLYYPYFEFKFFYYIILDYIPGTTLDNFLKNYKSLNELQIFYIIENILKGVEVIHETGFTHRDLKTENILFDENLSIFKVSDFTGAKFIGDETKAPNTSKIATEGYYPYEILSKSELDFKKVDLYAVGMIMYYCVFGGILLPKFCSREGFKELSQKIAKKLNKKENISDDLKNIIIQLTNFSPKDRLSIDEIYQTDFYKSNDKLLKKLEKDRDRSMLFEYVFNN